VKDTKPSEEPPEGAEENSEGESQDGENRLEPAIDDRSATVAIVGLGSVGLPLAATFVRAGFRVLGLDIDAERVAAVTRGERILHHFPETLVPDAVATGRFEATTDEERLVEADAALICVPTPISAAREPDLACVRAAASALARNVRPGTLVVLESTTYPGTTRDVVGGIFAEVGREVLLAYSPEREDPGRRDWTTRTIPKLVGGTCERSGELVERLYSAAFESVHRVARAEVAEAAKLFENVFRAVNIALVNEVKLAFEPLGLDVWEVLDAAATKPFGFMKFAPGPGLGGHCIPVDPFYLSWVARNAGEPTRFVELAGEINASLPRRVVERTAQALAQRERALAGARVLVLGLAYKAGVDLVYESPSLRLIELLREAGAEVLWSDPLVATWNGEGSTTLDAETLAGFDAVVLATDQPGFDHDLIAAHARLVVDTRNALASRLAGSADYVKA